MKILQVPVEDLSHDPANARKHPERNLETIVASLRRFGQQKPIVIDRNNIVRAGNGTLEAAKRLGWEKIGCVMTELNGADATAYAIADNRSAELAEWDDEILAATLNGLALEDGLLEAAGYDEDELAAMLAEIDDAAVGEVTEDEVPEPPADPITKPGDLWILGRHRLLCGDSTKAEDVGRLMDGAKVSATVTSPPYNVSAKSSLPNKEKYEDGGDSRSESDYLSLLERFTKQAVEISEYVFVNVQSVSGNKTALIDYLNRFSPVYADTIIWDKMGAEPAMAWNVMNSRFEYVHVFSKKANRAIGTKRFRGTVENMIFLNSRTDKQFSSVHKATFPVAFPAWLIERFTESGEATYDPFLGSGTTLIAAEQLGRKCYGMEISPQYCDVIVKRWETLTGQKATCQQPTRD